MEHTWRLEDILTVDYKLKVNDRDFSATAEKCDGDRLRVSINGVEKIIAWKRISDAHIFLGADGEDQNLYIEKTGGGKTIHLNGIQYFIKDARDEGMKKHPGGLKETGGKVTPPMPSVVVRILAAAGARVEKGEGLIVLTAMKLETTLTAPFSGTVLSVNVQAGDRVMPGQVLVEIDRDKNTGD